MENKLEENAAREFIGGSCLGAKILFDEVRPGVNPLEPENKLVVTTEVLTGIPFA